MDGINHGVPECDSIDYRIMMECNSEDFVIVSVIAHLVGLPKTWVWHRLAILEKFGYVEADPRMGTPYYRTTAKGKGICE